MFSQIQTPSNLLQHLNSPTSTCVGWYEEWQELLISDDPKAEEFGTKIQRALEENGREASGTYVDEPMDGEESMDVDSQEPDHSGLGEEFRTDPSRPPSNGSESLPFPGAAQPLPKRGESFTERMAKDEFASRRKKNLYYPFASEAEWQMASFLLRSGMTMKDIDDFLKLQLVRPTLINL